MEALDVDGKTLRGSFKRACSKTRMHLASGFVSGSRLVLGQQSTDCNSNEIDERDWFC